VSERKVLFLWRGARLLLYFDAVRQRLQQKKAADLPTNN